MLPKLYNNKILKKLLKILIYNFTRKAKKLIKLIFKTFSKKFMKSKNNCMNQKNMFQKKKMKFKFQKI